MGLCLLVVMVCVSAEVSTTQHADFFGTVCTERAVEMFRKERVVEIDYTFSLQYASSTAWNQFPDMNTPVYLKYSQYVKISYRILCYIGAVTVFITRVKIDNLENKHFRDASGHTDYHSTNAYKEVWMEKGLHNIKVEYRTNGAIINNTPDDWITAILSVEWYDF